MTTRDTNWPEGTPCWVDLSVDDLAKARVFYSTLLGWELVEGPEEFGGYSVCRKDGRNVAALMPKMAPEHPTAWTTYLATDDIEATLEKVRSHGGQVVSDAMPVASLGRMALVTDPEGAFAGLWQGQEHTGFQLADEPGSVTWNENFSRDWGRNRDFYSAVFGYTYDDVDTGDGMEYATVSVGGQLIGGIGRIAPPMREDTPPHWNVYFKVADVDAAVADVRRLGGEVLEEAFHSEFGRMAMVTDDQGAPFWVLADVS